MCFAKINTYLHSFAVFLSTFGRDGTRETKITWLKKIVWGMLWKTREMKGGYDDDEDRRMDGGREEKRVMKDLWRE